MSSSDSTGLLLVAHGTRSPTGVEQFLALTQSITGRLAPLPVEPAFLELAQPNIDHAVERLLSRGVTRLVTIPLLLFAAGHIKRDIPAAVSAALTRRGNQYLAQLQAEHLGCHPALTELSRLRMEEVGWDKAASAAAGPPPGHQDTLGRRDTLVPRLPPGNALTGGSRLREPGVDGDSAIRRGRASRSCGPRVDPETEISLLLVARGSRDDSATAEMYDFARLRQQDLAKMATALVPRLPPGNALTGGSCLHESRADGKSAIQRGKASRYCGLIENPGTENQQPDTPEMHVEVAFLAMARPLLSEKLAEVAAKRYTRVIVQPHFLFDGELVDSIGTQVAAMASNHPETEWLVTAPLADKPGFVTPATHLLQKVIFDRLQHVGIHVVAPAGDD